MIKRWPPRFNTLIRPVLIDRVERDHRETDQAFRRRRVVVVIVLAVGATLLGVSLAVKPGHWAFYPLTVALAATWVAGSFISGRIHLGRIALQNQLKRPIVPPILIGVAVGAFFILGSLAVRQVPLIRQYTENVLAHARYGSLALVAIITVLNGIAEEIFFRGALFAAIGVKHPVAISTAVYGVATIATLNPMLVFSAVLLGLILGFQRRATGGVLAPILTHITWSMIMLFGLPPIFAAAG
jgi:membrane protease YdiL (CAAX protease family)